MIRRFAIVAICGLVVCIVCLVGAAMVGGKALRDSGFNMASLQGGDFNIFDMLSDRPRCDDDSSSQQTSRSLPWTGGDGVSIELPANVHYRPGTGDQVVITGDSALISHVRVRGGSIRLSCRGSDSGDRLEITLPGRDFRRFNLAGTGKLTLEGIDQPELRISLAGAGEVEASGKTDDLDVEMAGASQAKLGALAAGRVKIKMAGANDAEIAPRDYLNAKIAGVGDVKLLTEPAKIESEIAGAGHIIHPGDLDKNP